MKRIITLLVLPLAMTLSATNTVSAQSTSGEISYSLPSTTIHLEVTALMEYRTPGPYAKFAAKYLGVEVPLTETGNCQLQDIKVTRLVEADPAATYSVSVSSKQTGYDRFLKMNSEGIVCLPGESAADGGNWRFPSASDAAPAGAVTSNLTSDQTTLYTSVKNAEGNFEKVAVRQSQVVEKSLERKAQEAADMIFKLRQKRIDIITGDTDASFSGEAMAAAINEITRMEEQYTELFLGSVTKSVQKACFDVVPNAEDDVYVAFRISDTDGLVSADNIGGRIVMMQLVKEESGLKSVEENKVPRTSVRYRVPAVCTMKLVDGQKTLLQSRIPVYQKGAVLAMPL